TEPVGSTSRVQVDVRVLAATNKDLLAEIRAGRFREDLYFRLNVLPIFVPPLRERAEDIPLLVEHFIADFALEYGRSAKTLTRGAMTRLQTYRWPGNVRELRNVIERVVIMAPGDEITERDLAFLAGDASADKAADDDSAASVPLYIARDQFEREYILRELAHQQGNISRTAEVLGVERSNLYRKMRAFGIVPRRMEAAEDSEEEAV
ncbi:MAG: sigma-54-dependent Fis family transcriptional regulator, partial [Acidobacteria bacterium]